MHTKIFREIPVCIQIINEQNHVKMQAPARTRTTHVRAGDSTLKEFGRPLKFVSGTPGIPSGDVKWSTS